MRKWILTYLIFSIFLGVNAQEGKNIYVMLPANSLINKKNIRTLFHYYKKDTACLIIFSGLTPESKKNYAAYVFNISRFPEVIDSELISNNNFYSPERIMDSLVKYSSNYVVKNRDKFYVVFKGIGSILYAHKATLTYLDPFID